MKKDKTGEKIKGAIASVTADAPKFIGKLHNESSLFGGKYLRARIFLSFSGHVTERSLKIAAAIELLHAATLVHDDILDTGKSRRGDTPLYLKRGISQAVIYGDYLFAKGLLILSELRESAFYREATKTLSETLSGEITETERRRDTDLTEKDYLSIAAGKSGVFFGMSCKLGAVERGANASDIKKAFGFGIKTGITYQILDDYNDYFNESVPREKRFMDIENGIITLPLIYMLENASEKERAVLRSMIESRNYSSSDMEQVCRKMIVRSVPERMLDAAEKHLEYAVSCLPFRIKAAMTRNSYIVHYLREKISYEREKYNNSRSGFCR